MTTFCARIFDKVVDVALTRHAQERLGLHLLYRARGEGNDDQETNGERILLERLKCSMRGRNAVLFDVGANVGEWSMAAVEVIGNESTIYAFEPSSRTFAKLLVNLNRSASKAQVIPVNVAFSDSNGQAQLYSSGDLAGTNSISKRHALGVTQTSLEEIVLERGDTWCNNAGIDHIDFLKIDTEGHEIRVLHGFDEMLAKQKIDFIQFEYGGTWIDARAFLMDAFHYLIPKGYKIAKIHARGVELFENYDQRQETFAYANYLAARLDLFQIVETLSI